MKSLVCIRPGRFEYTTGEQPELKCGQAIQVKDEFEGWLNPVNGVIKAMVEMN